MMNRQTQMINDRYEAMMFAKSAEEARRNARELARLVLGDQAANMALEEALRECCRELRPSHDPKEQMRYESEFIELGIWPTPAQHRVAA
jgi:predicted RNase H-like HicB family nuclease